jgi:hypothetical protein
MLKSIPPDIFIVFSNMKSDRPTTRFNVPADFDTIEIAFSGGKTAEKGIK